MSADSVEPNQAALYPTEFLNSITPTGLPLHRLLLREFASIILLRSLNPTQGMCNGFRLSVRTFLNHVIVAEIATGIHRGKQAFIPRILMMSSETDFPFVLKRKQFPISPAFYFTTNKGQGQSLESVGIFLPSPDAISSHGQLYVALRKVQNSRCLKVMVIGGSYSPSGSVGISNVVNREVFQYQLENFRDSSLMDLSLNDSPNSTPEHVLSMTIHPDFIAHSVNNFSLCMRVQLAQSKEIDCGTNISTRTETSIRYSNLQNYYSCLKLRLLQHFGQHLDIHPVVDEGNCLYRSLSHIIFGTETMYEQLKTKLICKIYENPEHIVNIMQLSGITCVQEFTEHLDCMGCYCRTIHFGSSSSGRCVTTSMQLLLVLTFRELKLYSRMTS